MFQQFIIKLTIFSLWTNMKLLYFIVFHRYIIDYILYLKSLTTLNQDGELYFINFCNILE